jgi:hypothetical protein
MNEIEFVKQQLIQMSLEIYQLKKDIEKIKVKLKNEGYYIKYD